MAFVQQNNVYSTQIGAATEIAAIYPARLDLQVAVSQAWDTLAGFSLLAVPVWEIRAKSVLPIIAAK
jgi:hypothetical protein